MSIAIYHNLHYLVVHADRECNLFFPLYSRLYTSFYIENYLGAFRPRKRDDGSYDYPIPLTTDARFAVFSVAETGQCAK